MRKDTIFYKNKTLRCGHQLINLSEPLVMGILNVTPDSFYDGGKYTDPEAIRNKTKQLVKEGADILDVGAYSSRPGATDISEKTEYDRLNNALDTVRTLYPDILISVDTFRSKIALKCIENYNVQIINDISGGETDPEMYDLVADKKVPYILMHMQGNPQNMQLNPVYENPLKELVDYFAEKTDILNSKGINDLIIDPGFGFGKTIEHNYMILSGLEVFEMFAQPLMVGLSRKSMIFKSLDISAEEALPGTIALQMTALMKGASILRSHDVREARQIVKLYVKLQEANLENLNTFKNNK